MSMRSRVMSTEMPSDSEIERSGDRAPLNEATGASRGALSRSGDWQGALLIGLLISICALPFIAWFFVPRFGTRAGIWAGAMAVGFALAFCMLLATSYRKRK